MTLRIDHISRKDRKEVQELLHNRRGDVQVVSRGNIHAADELPGLIARIVDAGKSKPVGLLTYHLSDKNCEIVTLDALIEEKGIGTALVGRLTEIARNSGWSRLWLITTNDNRRAQSFWARQGFRLAAIYPGAIEEARRLKPSIPLEGEGGIPITDELEYERILSFK